MLLRSCLKRTTIIILRHILYLVYLSPFPGLGIFMLYLCDLILIFNLFFIAINSISSIKQTHLIFCTFFRTSYVEYLHLELLSFCLIYCQFHPEVAWKSVALKKRRVAYLRCNCQYQIISGFFSRPICFLSRRFVSDGSEGKNLMVILN